MRETKSVNLLNPGLERQSLVPSYDAGQGTVLVVGASGKSAGLVVPALARRGAKIRAFLRKAEEAEAVLHAGAAEVAMGDLSEQSSVQRAMKGVS